MKKRLLELTTQSTNNPTSREDFQETWLSEMPMGIPVQNYYPNLVQNIKERIDAGLTIEKVDNSLMRIVGVSVVHYWYQYNDKIVLGTELTRRPQAVVVNFTAKDPEATGKPPYASDLYKAILNHSETPIRLVSDTSLSDEGLKIWSRLFNAGEMVVVYDNKNPGTNKQVITNAKDLLQYFSQGNPNFQRYQYVLVKPGEMIAETISVFNTRRIRELSGIL